MPISLDQSRAFDCINHEILLKRLDQYGIRGICNQWFRSYLSGRHQFVNIDKNHSEKRLITQGVPQGSILSAVLFILYINSLSENFLPSEIVNYADDVNFIVTGGSSEMQVKASSLCERIQQWFRENRLVLNSSKSVAVSFNLRGLPSQDVVFKIFNEEIPYCLTSKILGVHIDYKMAWRTHIEQLVKRLHSVLYLLRSLKYKVSPEVLKMVYYAKFHSLMTYGCTLWGQGSGWSDVFLCQKKAVRILNIQERDSRGLPLSCVPLFPKLDILPFPCQYILECITFVLKNGNQVPVFEHNHNTRNRFRHRIPDHSTSTYQMNVFYTASKFLNKLPMPIINLHNTQQKINAIKKFLKEKNSYSIDELLR